MLQNKSGMAFEKTFKTKAQTDMDMDADMGMAAGLNRCETGPIHQGRLSRRKPYAELGSGTGGGGASKRGKTEERPGSQAMGWGLVVHWRRLRCLSSDQDPLLPRHTLPKVAHTGI